MSVRSVTQAIQIATQNGDKAAGICLVKPNVSVKDAAEIVKAAGAYLDAAERSAIQQLVDRMGNVEVGDGTSASSARAANKLQAKATLASALALPKMPASIRAQLIKEKRVDLRKTAGEVCSSGFALIFLPGSCATTVLGAASMTDKDVAKLID